MAELQEVKRGDNRRREEEQSRAELDVMERGDNSVAELEEMDRREHSVVELEKMGRG